MKSGWGWLVLVFCFGFQGNISAKDLGVNDSKDGLAVVHKIFGYAVLTSPGSPIEKKLKAGDSIRAGDQIQTGQGGGLTIYFDHKKQNAVRIPAETTAVFTSIEPTNIELKNGTLLNVVDGQIEGSSWKISTPSAVAAVRGTVFIISYGTSLGDYYAATLEVPDDGKNSMIEISSLTEGGMARIVEGKEMELKMGEAIEPGLVRNLNPEKVSELKSFLNATREDRKNDPVESEGIEPPVIAEITESTCDANGRNCATKNCKMTAAGKVCDY